MHRLAILSSLVATFFSTNSNGNVLEAALRARQTGGTSDPQQAYLNTVCLPAVTSGTIPPCQEINNIESACLPNGTTPLDLLAHAECMCGGSYFADWIGCLDCNYVHGARSPIVTSAFHSILTTASNELCTGTPTAPFQSIFASLNYVQVPSNATGAATQESDFYPSQTAVSLYYTATGSQGPGPITGAATAATKVMSTTSSPGTSKTGTGTSSGNSKSATAGSGSTSSTKSSTAGAAATGAWVGGLGLAAGLAGMAVL